jgi:hypothetical protein
MGYVYPKSEGIILFTAYNPKSEIGEMAGIEWIGKKLISQVELMCTF